MMMMPPTWLTCLDVGQHADPDAVLRESRGRTVDIYTPEVVPDGDDFVLSVEKGEVDQDDSGAPRPEADRE